MRFAAAALAIAACHSPEHPRSQAVGQTLDVSAGGALRGVAGDHGGARLFTAIAAPGHTTVVARTNGAISWSADVPGGGGPIAASHGLVIVTTSATGGISIAGVPRVLRGDPGIVAIALDAGTGAIKWVLPVDSGEWAVASAIAATGDGVVIGGSFSGTLRAGAKVVTSAGTADGFVVKLGAGGAVDWLVRMGGPGGDAITGVAARGDRIAIAGTFGMDADLFGQRLVQIDDRSPLADGFVAELDVAGALSWVKTFGGHYDEAVAGVAIDNSGRVAVASSARGKLAVGGTELSAQGAGDGLVAWFGSDGAVGGATLIGGADFDGLRAICAPEDVSGVVVGGFFSGSITLGGRKLDAAGGDDAFLAALDSEGVVTAVWPVSGPGREEIVALAPLAGGFVAGIAHTAAVTIDRAALPAPADPMTGAAIAVRAAP